MSDFDGEMDVDDPPSKNAAQFSSDNTNGRGKRIAADLPIEAEDVLPWYYCLWVLSFLPHFQREKQLIVFSRRVEKYRPNSLEEVSGHHDIISTINRFIDKNVNDQGRSNALNIG